MVVRARIGAVLVGITGAVTLSSCAALAPLTPEPSDPAPVTPEAAAIQQVIGPWCQDVPVSVVPGPGGQAGYTAGLATRWWGWPPASEYIEVGDAFPVEHPATVAVALHECAHIVQYRVYDYDYLVLEAAMTQVYPGGTDSAVEHMADCMSDVMGAERTGVDAGGVQHTVGYGGACTEDQYTQARTVLAGNRV